MKSPHVTRRGIKIVFGIVALSCILAYNWNHTGGVLSSFVDPRWLGYVAAFGIEAVVVGLSLQISEARRAKTPDGFFVGTLIAVVIISAIANIAEGYFVKYGQPLEWANFGEIDFAQLAVWLSSTGLLSLVTFALAEIIGSDVTQQTEIVVNEISKPKSIETPVTLVLNQSSNVAPIQIESKHYELDTLLLYAEMTRDKALSLIDNYHLTNDSAYDYLQSQLPEDMTRDNFDQLWNELVNVPRPLPPLTDHFVHRVWFAKKHNAPFAEIEADVHECLNGQSAVLAEWYEHGQQSIAVFGQLLGVDRADDKNWKTFDYTCRRRAPDGTVIKREENA